MKADHISSRETAAANIIISCVTAVSAAVFIHNHEARIFLFAIAAACAGFMFLSKFYWKQYDKGMPYNPDLDVRTGEFDAKRKLQE